MMQIDADKIFVPSQRLKANKKRRKALTNFVYKRKWHLKKLKSAAALLGKSLQPRARIDASRLSI